jgi:hypothetical protein
MRTVAEIIAFFELTAIWLLIGVRYGALPALIHSPFNGAGDAYGLGPKNQLWLLLMLATLFYLFITAIPRLPLPINVPAGTPETTVAEIRRQIPTVFLALKIGILAFILWMAILATQHSPVPDIRAITVLLLFAVFAMTLGFVARTFLALRRTAIPQEDTTA